MPEFLTFALAAPLAAMGEIAVGERRGGWDSPGRSAILGLIAGCLGLEREDEAAHAALETGYGQRSSGNDLGRCLPTITLLKFHPSNAADTLARGRRS